MNRTIQTILFFLCSFGLSILVKGQNTAKKLYEFDSLSVFRYRDTMPLKQHSTFFVDYEVPNKINDIAFLDNNIYRRGFNTCGVAFKRDMYFEWNTCLAHVSFQNDTFYGTTCFNWTEFKDNVTFKCTFDSSVYFTLTKFEGNAEFSLTTFNSIAQFDYTIFQGPVTFWGAKLSDKTQFEHCQFLNSVEFTHASIPNHFNFSYVDRIDKTINLNNIEIYPKDSFCYIYLVGTDITKIRFNYHKFRLDFKYSDSYEDRCTVYESALNNFKSNGQGESYELLYKEYYKFQNPKLSYLYLVWSDFGYHKEYIFVWSLGLLIVFTFINYFFLGYLDKKVYKITYIPVMARHFPIPRLWYTFIYTSNIFFRFTLKMENINFKNGWSIYILILYTLGIVCLAYMANFVIQK